MVASVALRVTEATWPEALENVIVPISGCGTYVTWILMDPVAATIWIGTLRLSDFPLAVTVKRAVRPRLCAHRRRERAAEPDRGLRIDGQILRDPRRRDGDRHPRELRGRRQRLRHHQDMSHGLLRPLAGQQQQQRQENANAPHGHPPGSPYVSSTLERAQSRCAK